MKTKLSHSFDPSAASDRLFPNLELQQKLIHVILEFSLPMPVQQPASRLLFDHFTVLIHHFKIESGEKVRDQNGFHKLSELDCKWIYVSQRDPVSCTASRNQKLVVLTLMPIQTCLPAPQPTYVNFSCPSGASPWNRDGSHTDGFLYKRSSENTSSRLKNYIPLHEAHQSACCVLNPKETPSLTAKLPAGITSPVVPIGISRPVLFLRYNGIGTLNLNVSCRHSCSNGNSFSHWLSVSVAKTSAEVWLALVRCAATTPSTSSRSLRYQIGFVAAYTGT